MKLVVFLICTFLTQTYCAFQCPSLSDGELWLSNEENIASQYIGQGFQPCTENTTSGIESAGMCLLCSSVSRIVACVGMNVTHLPKPDELPATVDIYQVASSDVTIIPSQAFFNKTVKEIYIEHNSIEIMSFKAFEGVHGLKILSLANNNLPYFRIDTMIDLPCLETLILNDNNLELKNNGDLVQSSTDGFKTVLPPRERLSEPQLELKSLSLNGNPLKQIRKQAFDWLTNSKLSYLSLRGCTIETVHQESMKPLRPLLVELELSDLINVGAILTNLTAGLTDGKLEELSMCSSGLVRIPHDGLANVADSLVKLILHGNTFQVIDRGDFPKMPKLLSLDLRRCSIMEINDGAFDGLTHLKTLILTDNRFTVIHQPFLALSNLMFLDMSGNPDPALSEENDDYMLPEDSFSGLISLKKLNLGKSKLQKLVHEHFVHLRNLTHLSLCNTQLKTLGQRALRPLTSLQTLDLSGMVPLFDDVNYEVLLGLSSLTELHLTNSNIEFVNNSVNVFEELYNLRRLNLQNNKIRRIFNTTFQSLTKLIDLMLDDNIVESWFEPIFSANTILKYLSIQTNHISFMTDAMLTELQNFERIAMNYNPLQCDCNMEMFIEYVSSNTSNVEIDNWDTLLCYEPYLQQSIELYTLPHYDICEQKELIEVPPDKHTNIPIIASVCGVIGMVVMALSVVAYRKRNNIKYLAVTVRNAMSMALAGENDTEPETIFIYDVFVSYCDADRDWVIQQLLPALERDAQLRVCLHERDFQPGYGILDNIIHCIDKSKSLLFVVSKKSLKSQWCKFEMHLAQHRFVETNRDRFILVLMSDIPKTSRPRTLHYLMATRTYLIWNPEQPLLFWKRLKKTLLLNSDVNRISHA